MNEIVFRAGFIKPVTDIMRVEVRTSDAQKFINDKISLICNQTNQKEFDSWLITTDLSKEFKPFILLMPTSVLKKNVTSQKQKRGGLYDMDDDDNSKKELLELKREFYMAIQPYIYSDRERQMFLSREFERDYRVSKKAMLTFVKNTKPLIYIAKAMGQPMVTIALDPIRLFHDMLTRADNPGERFQNDVISVRQAGKNGEYIYTLERRVLKQSNNGSRYNKTLADELNNKFRSGR